MKKNIVHVFGTMGYGGAEITTIKNMEHLKNDFENIYFCTTSGEKGELSTELESKNYKIIPINIYSVVFPFKFYRLLKEKKIDIVHSHISIISGYIVFLAYIAGIKQRIVHFRSANISNKSKLLILVSKILITLFSTNILAVNNYSMKKHFARYKKSEKHKIIYNGKKNYNQKSRLKYLEIENELNIKDNEKIIIHIGRFIDAKNHFKIIEVFREYKKMIPNSKLILIGENQTLIGNKIRKKLLDDPLKENIVLLGKVNNVEDYLNLSDALIFPSLWEGLPGVVLEALSVGLPVVCSDIGSNIEIANKTKGLKIVSNDSDDKAWAQLLVNEAAQGKRAEIKTSFLKSDFNFDKSIVEFKKLYKLSQ